MWQTFIDEFIIEEGYKLTLQGLTNTVYIAVFGLLMGFLLGSVIAVLKLIPGEGPIIKSIKACCNFYVSVFRGTPIVVQLLLIHFAIFPAIGITLPDFAEAGIIFGFNSAAYISEIMRAGILSVDKGQMEAGRSLGFSYVQTMVKIVVPQAFKNILPTLGNEFISLIKETSVVSLIAVTDITKSFRAIADSTFEYFIPYIILGLTYYVIVLLISFLVKYMERRFSTDARK